MDDLLALEDRNLDHLGDPRQEAEAPGSIRIRCAAALPRRDRRPARIKDPTMLNRNPSMVQVLIVLSQKKLLASIMRKMESASSEISAATPTRRTAKPSPHDLIMHRMKTALMKNPMQKVPVAWLFRSAVTTR